MSERDGLPFTNAPAASTVISTETLPAATVTSVSTAPGISLLTMSRVGHQADCVLAGPAETITITKTAPASIVTSYETVTTAIVSYTTETAVCGIEHVQIASKFTG